MWSAKAGFVEPQHAVFLNHLERVQACACAGPVRTEAGVRLINRAVGLANERLAFRIEEAVVAVVQRNRYVTASVIVGEEFPLESPHKPLLRTLVAGEGKFYCFPFLNFIAGGNSYA